MWIALSQPRAPIGALTPPAAADPSSAFNQFEPDNSSTWMTFVKSQRWFRKRGSNSTYRIPGTRNPGIHEISEPINRIIGPL